MKHPQQAFERRPNGTLRVHTNVMEESMTQQQYKKDCDINEIVRKYEKTGEFTHRTKKQGVYGDFTEITNYQEMLHTVNRAQEAFMLLPAQTRARFENDPAKLLEFIQDPQNNEEAIKLGLKERNNTTNKPDLMENATQNQKKRETPTPGKKQKSISEEESDE